MKNYKGCYIDGIVFHNEAEIDAFLRRRAVEAYRRAVELFARRPGMEAALYAAGCAEVLADQHGMDWEEIEAIELDTLASCPA